MNIMMHATAYQFECYFRRACNAERWRVKSESEMWLATIREAIKELNDFGCPVIQKKAVMWFVAGDHEFACECIGLNPDFVYETIVNHSSERVQAMLVRAQNDYFTTYRSGCNQSYVGHTKGRASNRTGFNAYRSVDVASHVARE